MMLKPPQPWADAAARLACAGGLLPVAWRVHMLAWGAGWARADEFRSGGRLAYVTTLMAVEAAAAVATLGLVRPWGEVWPAWVPRVGGRRIPRRFVLGCAVTGAVALTAVTGVTAGRLYALRDDPGNPFNQMSPEPLRRFAAAHYYPALAWPVGLWTAIVGYAARHGDEAP